MPEKPRYELSTGYQRKMKKASNKSKIEWHHVSLGIRVGSCSVEKSPRKCRLSDSIQDRVCLELLPPHM